VIPGQLNLVLASDGAVLRNVSPAQRAELLLAAAHAGSADAQTQYGQMLLGDPDIDRDEQGAVLWFWTAANQGQAMAMNMLGRCYETGHGVAVDKQRASQWYRAAVDRNSDWAMYNLGILKSLGDGIPQDRPGAIDLFGRIVEIGTNAPAINYIAAFHEEGWIYPRDKTVAARLYALAAGRRHPRSMFNHARMLLDAGRKSEALLWLERALDAGDGPFRVLVSAWLAERSLSVASLIDNRHP
jgi:TPR repeat protein